MAGFFAEFVGDGVWVFDVSTDVPSLRGELWIDAASDGDGAFA